MAPTAGTSVAAVFSLIFGILGCIPMITSVLAVFCGIIGISATKDRRKGGRGLAVAGIVLGLIGIVLWGLLGGGVYTLIVLTRPARNATNQFVTDLGKGNVDAAYSQVTTDISKDDVVSLTAMLKPLGALKDVTSPVANVDKSNNTAEVAGVATFDKGQQAYDVTLIKQGDGWKIRGIHFTQPGTPGAPKTAGP